VKDEGDSLIRFRMGNYLKKKEEKKKTRKKGQVVTLREIFMSMRSRARHSMTKLVAELRLAI